jgi:hypothetical protein
MCAEEESEVGWVLSPGQQMVEEEFDFGDMVCFLGFGFGLGLSYVCGNVLLGLDIKSELESGMVG